MGFMGLYGVVGVAWGIYIYIAYTPRAYPASIPYSVEKTLFSIP